MAPHRAVGRLELVFAVRRDEHGGHHAEAAEARGYHVGEDVPVVVADRPEDAALLLHHLRGGVVDQHVAVGDAGGVEAGSSGRDLFGEDVLEIARGTSC